MRHATEMEMKRHDATPAPARPGGLVRTLGHKAATLALAAALAAAAPLGTTTFAGPTASGSAALGAQEWEPQIAEDAGTHPTGSILIQDVDPFATSNDVGVRNNLAIADAEATSLTDPVACGIIDAQ